MKKTGIYTISILFIFVLWLFFYVLINQPLLMPSPWDVLIGFIYLFLRVQSVEAIIFTIIRLVLAIGAAVIMGIIFGVIGSRYQHMSHLFRPYVTILRTIPVISFVVIILIVFGFRMTPYIITFLMVFPIIYQAIHDSIKGIDRSYLDVYHLEDDHPISAMRYCYFPLIKDQMTTAFLQSAGLGIKVLIMAEYLAQTPRSIGYMININRINLHYDLVFAWTTLLILFALCIEGLIIKYQKKLWNN